GSKPHPFWLAILIFGTAGGTGGRPRPALVRGGGPDTIAGFAIRPGVADSRGVRGRPPGDNCRLPGAIGLPSRSWVAATLSWDLYLSAAGPSAKARSTLVVTWRTNAGVLPPMPCGWSP